MATMTLELMVDQLRSAYGPALRSVVLYGSAAAGEHIAKRSDYNILVIVDALDLDGLTRGAAIARAWGEAGNPPPLTLTTAEWRSSSDIFPMEYADILERHRVLHGEPPFGGITVERQDLRLMAEQQAMGKLLQLRRGILAAGGDRRRLLELLAASLSTFMVLFRAVLRLHGEQAPTDYEALSTRVATLASFDAAPFIRVVRHLRGGSRLTEAEATDTLAGYLAGAQQLAAHIDRL